jgi:hypothetical protein
MDQAFDLLFGEYPWLGRVIEAPLTLPGRIRLWTRIEYLAEQLHTCCLKPAHGLELLGIDAPITDGQPVITDRALEPQPGGKVVDRFSCT